MSEDKSPGGGSPRIAAGVARSAGGAQSRGLTLAQVGEAAGLNIGYLSQIENDKAVPSLEALAAIAGALDVPPAWLLLDSTMPPRVVRFPTARGWMGRPAW